MIQQVTMCLGILTIGMSFGNTYTHKYTANALHAPQLHGMLDKPFRFTACIIGNMICTFSSPVAGSFIQKGFNSEEGGKEKTQETERINQGQGAKEWG